MTCDWPQLPLLGNFVSLDDQLVFIPFFLLFLSYSLAFMGVEGYGAGAWDS